MAVEGQSTVLAALMASLRERARTVDGQERPAAVLWPDPASLWCPLLPSLRRQMPELLSLGEYVPDDRSGPAIWLRTMMDGSDDARSDVVPESGNGRPPVLYVPATSRRELRAGDDCPRRLKPLVELLYRGVVWSHPNGKEWTPWAFLGSTPGLALDVAEDGATRQALQEALGDVAVLPISQLEGRLLDAEWFREVLSPDPRRDVLVWMSEGEAMRSRLGPERWSAFRSQCQDDFGFDPENDPDVVAGEMLGRGGGAWDRVWTRFAETAANHPGVVDLLRRSRPSGELPLFVRRERWPSLNDHDEASLRKGLSFPPNLDHAGLCAGVLALEEEHGPRREWVWAGVGLAPLAQVLAPLAVLAREVGTDLGGASPDDLASAYVGHGWKADRAAREALAAAPTAHQALIGDVVRRLLEPWMERAAAAFQTAALRSPLPGQDEAAVVEAEEEGCLLFVDGLRYELGVALAERLEARGLATALGHRWAALPTVTATGKPAVTPVAPELAGEAPGRHFAPRFAGNGGVADAAALRKAMERTGYQVLGDGTLDAPLGSPARGWMEHGAIDKLGHDSSAPELARRLGPELEGLLDRIVRLLELGWKEVRVVTDHGWLLLPDGLPKADLPQHLTVSRGARAASISGESRPDSFALVLPWHWNPAERFAAARGIGAFRRNVTYAHGGLSLQECLTPDLRVTVPEGHAGVAARIDTITWRGFRCLIEVRSVEGGEVSADLRLAADLVKSVARKVGAVGEEGAVSLLLAGDEHEASQLVVVLLDADGRILDRRDTRVGEDW